MAFWEIVKVKKYKGMGLKWDVSEFSKEFQNHVGQPTDKNLAFLDKNISSPVHNIVKAGKFNTKWICNLFTKLNEVDQHIDMWVGLQLLESTDKRSGEDFAPVKVIIGFNIVAENNGVLYRAEPEKYTYSKLADGWKTRVSSLGEILEQNVFCIPGDSVRIQIDLTVVEELSHLEKVAPGKSRLDFAYDKPPLPHYMLKWQKDMSKLLASERGADITIKCAGLLFKAHKYILSARSPVFARMTEMLNANNGASILRVVDIRPRLLEEFLEFIYSGNAQIFEFLGAGEWISLAKISRRYEMSDLHKICLDKMIWNIDRFNCVKILIFANYYAKDEMFQDMASYYCLANWKILMENPHFAEMMKNRPDIADKIQNMK